MTAFTHSKEAYRRSAHLRWIIFIIGILSFMPTVYLKLEDNRTYRDLIGITPFYGVTVDSQQMVSDGLLVTGTMIKRRCTFDGLSAYVTTKAGRFRVSVDTAPEDGQRPAGNRPPSPLPQLWGPWRIDFEGVIDPVTHWQIFAHHDCPERTTIADNLFAEGDWVDFAKDESTEFIEGN